MLDKMIKVTAAVLLAASGMAFAASPAGAGVSFDSLDLTPDTSDRQVGRWDFERVEQNGAVCAAAEYTVLDSDEDEVDEALYEIDAEPLDAATGTLTSIGLPAGFYGLVVECVDGPTYRGIFLFARLTVVKVVEGDPPEDAAFVIEADCQGDDPFVEELAFGPDGGTAQVYIHEETTCEVTETEDAGATSTEIENGTTEFEFPIDLTSTVTNTFAEAPPETTTTTTTTTTTPAPAAPAPAPGPTPVAQPVAATPTFVG
jgi:hypothetical protein